MAETPTRDQALATLAGGQAALDALFGRLSDEDLTRPATIGGGEWPAKGLMGHIAFWEEMTLDTVMAWRLGRRPAADQISSGGGEAVDAANAQDQASAAARSLGAVRERACSAHAAILDAIRDLSDDEWRTRASYPGAGESSLGERLGGLLGAPGRPFGHAFAHLAGLERYVRSCTGA